MSEATLAKRITVSLRETLRRTFRSPSNAQLTHASGSQSDLLFLRARALARSGALDMAERLYAAIAELEPTFAEAVEGQGELLDLTGQRALAVQKYDAARKLRASLRAGAPDRHFVLRQRGHFILEIMAYDSVLKSLKKNTLPYLARGNAYLATGRPKNALADYNRALRLKSQVPEITALRGEALSMLGRYVESLKAFDAVLAVHPADAEALSGRAIARIAIGEVDKANGDWRRQFGLLVGRSTARACVALRLADYGLALPELDSALVKEPDDPYWLLYRLTAQRRLGLPVASIGVTPCDAWPGPLLALHLGRMTEGELLKRADTPGRRAEALFQAGILAAAEDRTTAEQRWREVVDQAAPSLIEYAAARNELSRAGS